MPYKGRAPFQSAAFTETQRNFTYFDKSLTSGLTDDVIESPGDFLYIDQASTGVVSVELNQRQGGTLAPILLAAGGSIECDFASIKLNATAQLGKTIRIIVGNGARIKGGANVNADSMTVSVVDGARQRSQNGAAFQGLGIQAAVAGQYSHVQLKNPSNATANVFLESFWLSSGSASDALFGLYETDLTTLVGSAPSKKAGGEASGAKIRKQTTGGAIVANVYGTISSATTWTRVPFVEPVFLRPGYGFVVYLNTANVQLNAGFEFFEG